MVKPINFNETDKRGRVGDELTADNQYSQPEDEMRTSPGFDEHPELDGLLGQMQEPEPITPVRIEQNDYNLIVEHARTHGKGVINIPKGAITEHLNLAMDIPHNFNGFNLIGAVPDGSYVGDGSDIAADKTLNNCDLGHGVVIGAFCKLNNCRVGPGCKAGEGLEINGTEIQMLFEAKNVFATDSVIMGMCDINKLELAGDCVVYPGLNTDSLEIYGERNVLGDDDLAIPENAHPTNVYLDPDFTGSTVYNFMPDFVPAESGRLPHFTSVKNDLEPFVRSAIDSKQSLDDGPRHSGPGMRL